VGLKILIEYVISTYLSVGPTTCRIAIFVSFKIKKVLNRAEGNLYLK
jgi:hypothetical protein